MDLNKAIEFADIKLAEGNKSDGCTSAPELGISIWCKRHDMWRRFRYNTPLFCDNLFFKGIITEGYRYYPIACIYWLGVRIPNLLGIVE